jgi:hypothetical protein
MLGVQLSSFFLSLIGMGCGEGKNLSLKGFHFPALNSFTLLKWDYYEINKQNTISAGG